MSESDPRLSTIISELQKLNSTIIQLNNAMENLNSKYNQVISQQEQTIKVQRDQSSLLDAQLDYLYTTAESINRMALMDLNTQLIETDITKQTSATLEIEAQRRMERAIEKYREEYSKIIRDFVNGIVANIKHFAKLNEEHIRPLFDILENLERVHHILNSFTAKHPDEEILEYAVSTFNERKNRIDRSYSETKEVLSEFLGKREEAEDTVNTFYIRSEELSLEDNPEETISMISIPFVFTFISDGGNSYLNVNGPLIQEHEEINSSIAHFKDLCPSISKDLVKNEKTKNEVLKRLDNHRNLLKPEKINIIIRDLAELLRDSGFYPKHLKNLNKLFNLNTELTVSVNPLAENPTGGKE